MKKINILNEIVNIVKQYLPELMLEFYKLTDKRHQSYVAYKKRVIFLYDCHINVSEKLTSI